MVSAVATVIIQRWSDILTSGMKHTTRVEGKHETQRWRGVRARLPIVSCEGKV